MKEHWFRTVLRHTTHCRGKMIISVIFAIIAVAGGVVPYYSVYKIVIILTGEAPEIAVVVPWLLVCLAGFLIWLFFHAISTTLSHISAYTILNNIRLTIAERLMGAPLGVVINEKVGRLKNAIIDRVELIELPIAHMIPECLSGILITISVLVYLFIIDFRMALAAMVTLPPSFLIVGIALNNYTEKYRNFMKTSDHVNSVIVEYSEGIEVIKMFNQSDSSYKKFEEAVLGVRKNILNWGKSIMGPLVFAMALLPSTMLGIVPVGILLFQNGILTPAEFVLCIILGIGIVPPLMRFSTYVNELKMVQYAVNDSSEFLYIQQLENKEEPVQVNGFDIAFNDVCFSYNDDKQVLNNINIDIKENSFCALIGPSGGGKSTIARLIARFWDVSSGEITIDGKNIKDIPLKQLSKIISFVTQDNFLFDCSLLENIRMGNPDASDEEVYEAAKLARCHDFIEALKNGWETTAGEAGNRLSGGEKQRITIARAILKDAPIVILDEATTYADPENEWEIQKSVSALAKNKTLLVIAHRLSTVKDADRIILIEDGKEKISGTHDELLDSSFLYKSMWDAHISTKTWSPKVKEGEARV